MSWIICQSVEKPINSVNMLYLLFLRDKYERKLLLEEGNNKQSQSRLFNELKVDCV